MHAEQRAAASLFHVVAMRGNSEDVGCWVIWHLGFPGNSESILPTD
jgi:hypothetical protein